MLRMTGARWHPALRVAPLAAVVLVVALVAPGALAPPKAGGGARVSSSHPPLTRPSGVLGAALAHSLAAQRAAYWQPPPVADVGAPAVTINLGPDQPDPFMVVAGGRHYLFTSQGQHEWANVPVRSGPTADQLGDLTDALPTLPPWAQPGNTWAPDVHRFGSYWVLTFTAAVRGLSPITQCIGNAIGTSVDGPYVAAPAPLVCQLDQGGSIDPRVFVDANGTTYLLWKSDENSDVNGTSLTNIYSQRLSPAGLHLMGAPTRIFGPDEPWQGRIVEAPDLVQVQGGYYLFYSGNWFNQPDYAIGVAFCAGPLGPCHDAGTQPLLASNLQGDGPGEESIFTDTAGVWLLYTPFRSNLPLAGPPRPVAMARLGFGPLGPYLAQPEVVPGSS
jgi:hypothetical protein